MAQNTLKTNINQLSYKKLHDPFTNQYKTSTL